MTRDLDPNDPEEEWSTVGPEHWTDYDIAMPYGDFDVTLDPNDAPVETEQMRYLEGFGLPAQQTVSSGATGYLHGDLIRSTVMTTNDSGAAVASVAYTAFGEPIGTAPETRYQYAGGWGYESDLLVLNGAEGTAPITLQHVGHRWYQPDIGRFIQRDPIGMFAGLNVYEYVHSTATIIVDPSGLYWDYDDILQPDGSLIRHFYDRGWFGTFKNEYRYSVRIPAGKTPPAPPRTIDRRVKCVGVAGAVGGTGGAVTGGLMGIPAGLPGIVGGAMIGYVGGWIFGVGGGIINEFIYY
ncbi:MAG TPA: RHS repeat-associated core domain-containing protein [Phycisphaerae bacterium]|nr:RHS repeat-associated core domain-containing protein [Phycisphaerae bacterium]